MNLLFVQFKKSEKFDLECDKSKNQKNGSVE